MKSPLIAVVLGLALLLTGVKASEGQQGPCDQLREQWIVAFGLLQQGASDYRSLKEESAEPSISSQLKAGTATNIARAVQTAMAERKKRLTVAETKLRSLADEENLAFKRWNECSPGGRWARASSPTQTPRSVADQRRQLKATLDDLLLEEAYLQYKHTAPRRPSDYSDYNSPYNAPYYWR